MSRPRRGPRSSPPSGDTAEPVVGLRIIGGNLRGRKLQYSGDVRTRPMKDRVREAVFNLLGHQVAGTHAIDLFAGTGALGFEALSRGASRATFIERHWPTSRLMEQNAAALGLQDRADVVFGDAFAWSAAFQPTAGDRFTVFCSPPYEFYVTRQQDMLALVARWLSVCSAGSQLVVEADDRFDMRSLPQPEAWDVREYPPAVVAIWSPLP